MQKRTFTTSTGTTFALRYLSESVLMAMNNIDSDLPTPQRVVRLGMDETEQIINDYDSKGYQDALAAYNLKNQLRSLRAIFTVGVLDNIPDDEKPMYVAMCKMIHGEYDALTAKYLWIMDNLPETEDIEGLSTAITSQAKASEADIQKSLTRFPHTD